MPLVPMARPEFVPTSVTGIRISLERKLFFQNGCSSVSGSPSSLPACSASKRGWGVRTCRCRRRTWLIGCVGDFLRLLRCEFHRKERSEIVRAVHFVSLPIDGVSLAYLQGERPLRLETDKRVVTGAPFFPE